MNGDRRKVHREGNSAGKGALVVGSDPRMSWRRGAPVAAGSIALRTHWRAFAFTVTTPTR